METAARNLLDAYEYFRRGDLLLSDPRVASGFYDPSSPQVPVSMSPDFNRDKAASIKRILVSEGYGPQVDAVDARLLKSAD